MTRTNPQTIAFMGVLTTALMAFLCIGGSALAQGLPNYYVDPAWPKPLPNNWKIGGVMGVAIDSDGDIWIYNRPNDLTALELRAEPSPSIAECCVRPPSMIHLDAAGNVIGSFDAPQGHGMDVDD